MNSGWDDAEAAKCSGDLALRCYTSRLLGRDRSLVLHGGGNTSVKMAEKNILGEDEDILYVKGSGWDLETIEAAGFAPVRLAHLQRLARLPALSDLQMVNELATHLTRASAPAPSVEAILHAILPYKCVDHTHADAVLTITNTRDGEARIRDVYGDLVVVIPYVMPGFDLARICAERFPAQAGPNTVGMVLLNHGIFSFGGTARESYERMIMLVSRAEEYLRRNKAWDLAWPDAAPGPADVALDLARTAPGDRRERGISGGRGAARRREEPRLLPARRRRDRRAAGTGDAGPLDPHQEPAAARPRRRRLRRGLSRLFRGARAAGEGAQDDARSGAAPGARSRARPVRRRPQREGRRDRRRDLRAHDGRHRPCDRAGRLPGAAGEGPVRRRVLGPRAGEAGQGRQAAGVRGRGRAGDRRRVGHRQGLRRLAAGARRRRGRARPRSGDRGAAPAPRLSRPRRRRDLRAAGRATRCGGRSRPTAASTC